MALAQLPTLALRGPLARWCGAEAGTSQAGARPLLVPDAGVGSVREVSAVGRSLRVATLSFFRINATGLTKLQRHTADPAAEKTRLRAFILRLG